MVSKTTPSKEPKSALGGPPKAPKLGPKSGQNRPRTLTFFSGIPFGTALGTPGASGALRGALSPESPGGHRGAQGGPEWDPGKRM